MNSGSTVRLELLSRDNYDTWKLQMRAVLIRNSLWGYVNGSIPEPPVTRNPDGSVQNQKERKAWQDQDEKALADITLSIMPSEVGQIKHCSTSREAWMKLSNVYKSRGPARKARLMKQLVLTKMKDGDDVRDHTRRFGEIVDKLNNMNIVVNEDLLSVMLLYSLPPRFESFRIAIETRDELPTLEQLKTKIIEESDARDQCSESFPGAMAVTKDGSRKEKNDRAFKNSNNFKIKCYRCKKLGHK